jgi:integrase/recombinase XerD
MPASMKIARPIDWPDELRRRWETSCPPTWSSSHRSSVQRELGRWSAYCAARGSAFALPTPDDFDTYVGDLERVYRPASVVTSADLLLIGLQVLFRDADLAWLRERCGDLRFRCIAPPRRPAHSQGARAGRTLTSPVADWPEAWQKAWRSRVEVDRPGRFLDLDADAVDWSADYCTKIERAVGRFVGSCRRRGEPVEPTKAALAGFIHELEARGCSMVSVAIYLADLRRGMEVLCPDADLHCLRRAAARARRHARPDDKAMRVADSRDLKSVGTRMMREAAALAPGPRAALQFRNGLMIAILSMRPVRVRNLSETEVDVNVGLDDHGGAWIRYSTSKNDRPYAAPLDADLAPFVRTYLERMRPVLLRGARTQAFWIDRYGKPLGRKEMTRVVTSNTRRHFGRPLSPHLFRHSLLTTLTTITPTAVTLGAALLGNVDGPTVRRHYDLARSSAASRTLQDKIAAFADSRPA